MTRTTSSLKRSINTKVKNRLTTRSFQLKLRSYRATPERKGLTSLKNTDSIGKWLSIPVISVTKERGRRRIGEARGKNRRFQLSSSGRTSTMQSSTK